MIQIVDKNDGERKLRRSYEDYLPLETSEPQQPTEPAEPAGETTEPTETTEQTEQTAEPTAEPNEAEN